MFIDNLLIENANLMINFLVAQLAECLLGRDDPIFIVFEGVDDVIVGHAAVHQVVELLHFASASAVNDIFEPFEVVSLKYLNSERAGFNGVKI